MYIVFSAYNAVRVKKVDSFTVVNGYVHIGTGYLTGSEGGRIHRTQILSESETKPNLEEFSIKEE